MRPHGSDNGGASVSSESIIHLLVAATAAPVTVAATTYMVLEIGVRFRVVVVVVATGEHVHA